MIVSRKPEHSCLLELAFHPISPIGNRESAELSETEHLESRNKMALARPIPKPIPRSTAPFQKPSRCEPEATPGSQKPS